MIFGNVNNKFFEEQLAILPLPLQHAVRFLHDTDFKAHEPGVFNIELGDIPVILQVLDLTTAPRPALRPEIHRKNIDVQFLACGGPENAGFYIDDNTGAVDENLLDTPRDILFYRSDDTAPEGTLRMIPGTYAIYFPWDVHIPAIQVADAAAPIRKIVLKVPVAACTGQASNRQ